MSHRNARLTPRGAYSSSSGFEIRACLLPMSPKRWESHANAPIAGAALRRGGLAGLEDRSSRPHRSPRRTTPAVSAESWPPPKAPLRPSPLAS